MNVGLGELEGIDLTGSRHNGNELWFGGPCRGRSRLPSLLPPGDLFVPDICTPATGPFLF